MGQRDGVPDPSGQKERMGHSAGNEEFPGHSDPGGHKGQYSTPSVGLKDPGGHPSGTDEPAGHCVAGGQMYPPLLLIGYGVVAPPVHAYTTPQRIITTSMIT